MSFDADEVRKRLEKIPISRLKELMATNVITGRRKKAIAQLIIDEKEPEAATEQKAPPDEIVIGVRDIAREHIKWIIVGAGIAVVAVMVTVMVVVAETFK